MLILPEIAINVVCEEQGEQILCLLWIIARSLPDFVRAIEKGVPVDEQAVSRLAEIKIVLHQTLNYLPHVRLGKDGCRVFGKDALQKEASRVPVQVGNTRSEERRVGKECRSQWTPIHQKKNKKQERLC